MATGNEGGKADPMTCYDATTGKRLWRLAGVPRQGLHDVRASGTHGEYDIPGLGRMVCTWQWHGNYRAYFVTTDGLYVGTAQPDNKLGPTGLWGESYRYFHQPQDTVDRRPDDRSHVSAR